MNSNILDKSDKSMAPVFARPERTVSVSKRDKYQWSQGGSPGRFELLSKREMNIDGRYQRGMVSENKVKEIARSWDWVLFGVLLVVIREDGTYWVFDGGHRTRAAFYRDDIDLLPCMVYEIGDLPGEAKAFLGKNLMITGVEAVDRYRAAVIARDPSAEKVEKLLVDRGIGVERSAVGRNRIKCVKALTDMVSSDEVLAARVLDFCLHLAGESSVSSYCLRGLFYLCRSMADKLGIDVLDQYGEKIKRHSQGEIEILIRRKRAETGLSGIKVEMLAFVDIINKGCRSRLSLDGVKQ